MQSLDEEIQQRCELSQYIHIVTGHFLVYVLRLLKEGKNTSTDRGRGAVLAKLCLRVRYEDSEQVRSVRSLHSHPSSLRAFVSQRAQTDET